MDVAALRKKNQNTNIFVGVYLNTFWKVVFVSKAQFDAIE